MRNRAGFTLVEMVVAVAITLMLVVLMTQVIGQSNTIWTRSNENADTFREARAALQMMAQEIGQVRAMALPKTTFPLLALQVSPETQPEDQKNEEIYALTSIPNSGKADLCAVGYFCRWNSTLNTYTLARQFSNSDVTYASMKTVFNGASPMSPQAAFGLLYQRAASNTSGAAVDDLAAYVWDLHFMIPNVSGLGAGETTQFPQGYFSLELPPWVEVRCKALGMAAAKHLAQASLSRDVWFSPNSPAYQTYIRPYQKEFVTRIGLAQ